MNRFDLLNQIVYELEKVETPKEALECIGKFGDLNASIVSGINKLGDIYTYNYDNYKPIMIWCDISFTLFIGEIEMTKYDCGSIHIYDKLPIERCGNAGNINKYKKHLNYIGIEFRNVKQLDYYDFEVDGHAVFLLPKIKITHRDISASDLFPGYHEALNKSRL